MARNDDLVGTERAVLPQCPTRVPVEGVDIDASAGQHDGRPGSACVEPITDHSRPRFGSGGRYLDAASLDVGVDGCVGVAGPESGQGGALPRFALAAIVGQV